MKKNKIIIDNKEYITIKYISRYYGIGSDTIRDLKRRKKIKDFINFTQNFNLYNKEEIENMLIKGGYISVDNSHGSC